MKNHVLLILFFTSTLSVAQVIQRNILSKKYTLQQVQQSLLSRAEYEPYPKTPATWASAVPDSVLASIIKTAEELLDYKFEPISATIALDFVRSGDRIRHSTISFEKRNALINLSLAESMEDKGRFTEAILNGIWSICEESYWGVPAHIRPTGLPDVDDPVVDLFTAETAATLSLADYFIGEKLDKINPLIRKRIYLETNKRFFIPLLTKSDSYSWMSKNRTVNNWNPWIMSNWIASTLLLEPDQDRRAEMIYKSMNGLDLYFNGLGEDGGCDEGPSYWFAAGASAFDCLELLEGATKAKINIYDDPLIKKMASYIYKTHIDGHYFVNFADADPKLMPDGLMLYRFGKAIRDNTMIGMGKWAFNTFPSASIGLSGFQRPRKVENLLTIHQLGQNTPVYTPLPDAWISDIQVLTARASNGFYLATHGGHNAESHNHNDVGDFLLYADGEPVIIDAGRGNYTARTFSAQRYELWFTQSQYHNLPIVNGYGQRAGRDYEAKNVQNKINESQASLNMDIAGAYDKDAGITSWNRTVNLNRFKNQLEITDDYVLTQKPTSLQQIFMTACQVDLSKPGKIVLTTPKKASYSIQYDPNLWSVSTEFPSTEGMEYSSFKTKWDGHQVQRIVLNSKKLVMQGKNVFSLIKN
ncbi:MAG: heparinase II/III family protein [Saprospiraceae bacterium]|nr:heparinase II/III family protein [Saprospiraceae bacterium]